MDISFVFERGKPSPKQDELKAAYRSVFGTPAGRVVLKDLLTSLRLVQNPSQGHAAAADERAFNDGKRSLALHIVDNLVN